MKKTALIMILAVCSVSVFAQNNVELKKNGKTGKTEVPSVKTLVLESNRVDLGDGIELKNTEFKVKVKNAGDKPINIGKVSTTAFLKVQSKPKTAILPGQTAELVFVHTPSKGGQFLKLW